MPSKKKSAITLREAHRADIPALIELNKIAYPVLAAENVVWGERHLLSHQRIFPQGQIVAEIDGKIVGAAASLLVDLGPDPLRNHTWSGITDSGYFTNHNPAADTLYGADVCVHPDYRGRQIGAALYEARRQLCRRLNKRRILAGGRLWNYEDHAGHMSAEEYAQRVISGELKDLVLSFQLREGFVLRGVMPNYLHDPKSHNYGSLIEWLNPDYKEPAPGARKVRLACVQYQMRKVTSFADFERQVTYFVDVAADYHADFVLMPEFVSVQLLSQEDAQSPIEGIRRLARYEKRFTELMRKNGYTMKPIEDFSVQESGGLIARVGGDLVYVGPAAFMKLMGVRVARGAASKTAVCTAINDTLAGIFEIGYAPVTSIQRGLLTLLRGGTEPVFAVRDFNVTPMLVQQKFRLPRKNYEFPSFATRYRISSDETENEGTVAAVFPRGGLNAVAGLIRRGRKLYRSLMVCDLVSILGSFVGMVMMLAMCWQGAWDSASCANAMSFLLAWLIPVFVVSYGLRD